MRALATLIVSAAATCGAYAQSLVPVGQVFNLDGSALGMAGSGGYQPRSNPTGVVYSVYTGLTNAANQLFLIEGANPGSDLRTFGAAPAPINPYNAAAGSVIRTVTDSAVANGGGGYDLLITITGTSPTGGPGNLFPSGFSGGNPVTPLTGAGVGLGLNLGALGSSPLAFPPDNFVTSASLRLVRASGASTLFNLPPNTFFGGPGAWSGVVGISVGGGAGVTTDPFTTVIWDIRTVPTPGAVSLLAFGGLIAARRRR